MLRHNQEDFTYEIQDVSRHHVSSSANMKVAIRSFIGKIKENHKWEKQVVNQEKYTHRETKQGKQS